MISPLTPASVHSLLIRPYQEGAERINRAFLGLDTLYLQPIPLSGRERIRSFCTGLLLILPLLNMILWIAMQSFSHPMIFSDPSDPSLESGRP